MTGDPHPAPTSAGERPARGRRGFGRWWWLVGLAIAAAVVIVLVPLASGDPDGLESVAGQQGWLGAARDALFSVIPDYAVPGIDDPALAKVVAGLVGVALVFLVMVGLGRLLRRPRA